MATSSTRTTALVLAAACALAGGTAAAQGSGSAAAQGAATVARTEAARAPAMQQLQQATDRLRQSIQALAQKPPGPDRESAIASAHEALMRTQQAMMSLPPELRSTGTVSTAGYDESVRKLMQSADSLRHAVQEMAQLPAGDKRNAAIREANRALLDTQSAMVAAYQPGGTSKAAAADKSSTRASGASGSSSASQSGQQSSRPSTSPAGAPAAVLVLLPNAQAQGNRLADGCWVRFFDEKNYQGDALTLAGPVDLPRMELGNAWRDWDSAMVGPKATVRTYDNENFADRSAVLTKGQSIPDLRDRKLGWFEEVKSARVQCS